MSEMLTITTVDGVRVVTFGDNVTTGEAYDMTQCYDEIKDGDVLHVLAEGVVGVMVKAWPVAVSEIHGAFHGLASEIDIVEIENGEYEKAGRVALAMAGSLLQ